MWKIYWLSKKRRPVFEIFLFCNWLLRGHWQATLKNHFFFTSLEPLSLKWNFVWMNNIKMNAYSYKNICYFFSFVMYQRKVALYKLWAVPSCTKWCRWRRRQLISKKFPDMCESKHFGVMNYWQVTSWFFADTTFSAWSVFEN